MNCTSQSLQNLKNIKYIHLLEITYGVQTFKTLTLRKNFMAPFWGWSSTVSKLQSHYDEPAYFLSLSPQEVLVLIWSTLEGWKASWPWSQSVSPGTPGLGIQHPNHQAIASLSCYAINKQLQKRNLTFVTCYWYL